VNETREYEHKGKKVRIVYISHCGYFVMSINNRLLPQQYKTKIEAMKAAFRILADEDDAGN